MVSTYFSITDNCNLKCKHCFCSSGPGGESISLEDGIKILDHVPSGELGFSGGEVFTEKDLLYGLLEYAQDTGKFEYVYVMTNGLWATNPDITQATIRELSEFGVKKLGLASNDNWHRVSNIRNKIRQFKEACDTQDIYFKEGGADSKVCSIGRARNLPMEFIDQYPRCDLGYNNLTTINVDRQGHVFACCFLVPRMIGNLIDTPWDEIIELNMKHDPFMREIILSMTPRELGEKPMHGTTADKIQAFAEKLGIKQEEDRGICGLCSEVFDVYNKERGLE